MKCLSRVVPVVICLVLVISLFAGCGAQTIDKNTDSTKAQTNTETKGDAKAEPGKTAEPTKISFIHWRNEDADAFKKVNKIFEDKNTDITIDMQITTPTDYYNVIKPKILAKEDLDVICVHPGSKANEFYQAGALTDLTGKPVTQRIIKGALDAGIVDGKVVTLVQQMNSFVIFYNKKIFEKYSLKVPTTFQELENIVKVLKENKIEPISIGLGDSWPTAIIYHQLFGSMAKDPAVLGKLETGEVKMTDPFFKDVYNTLAKMGKQGFFQKGAAGTKYEQSITLFSTEKTAMLATGTWSVGALKKANPQLQMGYFTLTGPNGSQKAVIAPGQGLSIYKGSKHADQAMKYIDFLFSKEGASIYANDTAQLSSVTDVEYNEPEIKEVQKLMNGPSIPALHLIMKETKISDSLLPESATKVTLGEDVNKTLEDTQKQIDQLVKK